MDEQTKKVSIKRQKHIDRQNKKMKDIRTKEERAKFVDDITKKLEETNIPHDVVGIIKFKDILKKYLEYGDTMQGVIPLSGFKYEIQYNLHRNRNFDCGAMLKANPHI